MLFYFVDSVLYVKKVWYDHFVTIYKYNAFILVYNFDRDQYIVLVTLKLPTDKCIY